MFAVDDRLAELAELWELPAGVTAQLRTILELVEAEPTSITTVRDPERGVELHVADSLAGLAVPALREAATIADLGSGGGFPGLVLAAALPETRVTLVESVGKKCEFLAAHRRGRGSANVTVVNARAEAWWDGHRDARTSSRLGRWRRSTWSSSTPRRCWSKEDRSSRGRDDGIRPPRLMEWLLRRSSAWSPQTIRSRSRRRSTGPKRGTSTST